MKKTLAVTAIVALATHWATGTEYVVAPTGNDLAAGTAGAPWLTLQHAADVVMAGDQVTVRSGNYTGFYLGTSGTASAPIEFLGEPGASIIQRNAFTPDGINLESASYVTIDGFAVTGMPRAGVRAVGDSDRPARFVTVRNVTATNNTTWGIFTGFVDDLLIESNTASGSVNQHGIYVSNSGDRPVIRNNVLFGNNDAGIHMNGDASQGGDGIITGAIVSGNRIFDNGLGGASGINMDGVQNSLIENNLLYNNHASGISLYQIDGGGPSTGNIVVNNTIDEASNARWALNIQNASTGNTVLNNILLNENPAHGAIDISPDSLAGLHSDYNAVVSRFTTNDSDTILTLPLWQAQTGQDQHSTVSDAQHLFVNAAAADYHLISTAPAINAGTSTSAPATDLDGNPRPIGGVFDIGAYEFGASATPVTGDYNRNGAVDAADYVIWRRTIGQSVPKLSGADGDGDGLIGPGDYNVWRSNFGLTSAGAQVIPEPGTVVLIVAGLGLLASWRGLATSS
jgi:parallel beta-helix repeat protein